MPAAISRSAKPITPRPILRLPRTASVICATGNSLTSTTSSRKRVAIAAVSRSAAQSTSPAPPPARGSQKRARWMEPSVQASHGSSGTSPQGFVASIAPSAGVGLVRLMVSRKTSPGSPVLHAACAISSSSARASTVPRGLPSRGSRSVKAAPSAESAAAAAMNSSVTPMEILKRVAVTPSSFAWMKARTSG